MLLYYKRITKAVRKATNKMSDEVKTNEENKPLNDTEEIKEFNKEVLGKLDSPLVVHKKGDASYEENTSAFEMNETHTEEERPTLARHRFKKEKKSKKGLLVFVFIIFLLAGVFAGLYYTGNIRFNKEEATSAPEASVTTTTETTTSLEMNYKGKIVVKDVYIFVDGVEVDGIEGLQRELKYVKASPTAYEIIDEHANADFLNGEVLKELEKMGFFTKDTVITHIQKTGLVADAETTTLPPETTTKKNKKKNKNKKNSNTTTQSSDSQN